MSVPPDQFSRISDRLDIALLGTKLVVVVGVGTVGSQVAAELANNSVGHLRLIDGDYLEESNLIRHALTRSYLGFNKAEALTLYLADEVPTLQAEALPRNIDESMSDDELDKLLSDADLIVAATDDRDAQRRIARRALALDIPTVLPALYGDNGGEIFVQRSSRNPCFFCWDGFRPRDERLRGVAALNADTLAVLQLTVQLSLGVLDRRSEYADFMVGSSDDPRPLQLFVQRRHAALERAPQRRRLECPLCAVGPSPLRPEAREAWDAEHTRPGPQQAEASTEPSTILRLVLTYIGAASVAAALGAVAAWYMSTHIKSFAVSYALAGAITTLPVVAVWLAVMFILRQTRVSRSSLAMFVLASTGAAAGGYYLVSKLYNPYSYSHEKLVIESLITAFVFAVSVGAAARPRRTLFVVVAMSAIGAVVSGLILPLSWTFTESKFVILNVTSTIAIVCGPAVYFTLENRIQGRPH